MGNKRKAEVLVNKDEIKPKGKKLKIRRLLDVYERIAIEGDGNCLFRAILHSLYGKDEDHYQLRLDICKFMQNNASFFRSLVEFDPEIGVNNWDSYIKFKKQDKVWGDACELWAASEMLQFNYIVYKSNSMEITDQRFSEPSLPMIYLEYYNRNHYNSLRPKEQPKILVTLKRKCEDINDDFLNVIKKEKENKNNEKETHSELDILQVKPSKKLMRLSQEVKPEPSALKDELQKGIIVIDYNFS